MILKNIDNSDSEELKVYRTLRESGFATSDEFIADSPKVVNLLLKSDIKVKSILATQEYYEEHKDLLASKDIAQLYVASKDTMESIVGHKVHHNCMMHALRPKESTLEQLDDTIVMLDGITSTENIGSIARSMAALGVHSYILPKSSPHPYARRAVRVSMGYVSSLKYMIYDDTIAMIRLLKERGYRVLAAELDARSVNLANLKSPQKWVLIMGHEGRGISEDILNECDEIISIEMQEGVKSFNVAVAASLIIYKLTKL